MFSFSFSFLLWAWKHGRKSANSNFVHNSLWLFHLWCPYCSISNPDPVDISTVENNWPKNGSPESHSKTGQLARVLARNLKLYEYREIRFAGADHPLTRPYKSICQGGSPPYPRLQINFQRRVTCLWKPILLETNLYPPLQNFLFLTTLFLPFFSFIILPSHF